MYIEENNVFSLVKIKYDEEITKKALEYILNPEIQGFIEQKAIMLTKAYVKSVYTEVASSLYRSLHWESIEKELKKILVSLENKNK